MMEPAQGRPCDYCCSGPDRPPRNGSLVSLSTFTRTVMPREGTMPKSDSTPSKHLPVHCSSGRECMVKCASRVGLHLRGIVAGLKDEFPAAA